MLKLVVTAFTLILTSSLFCQDNHLKFSINSGVSRSMIYETAKDITAIYPTPGFSEKWIVPSVKNTIAFFTYLKTLKKIKRHWLITNEAGIDMQQLVIESGFKKTVISPGLEVQQQSTYSKLISRIKIAFGADYLIYLKHANTLGIGAKFGEKVNLNNEGFSYSFIGTQIAYNRNKMSYFISLSQTPYNIDIPKTKSLIGDVDARYVYGYLQYRILDVQLGFALNL